MRLERDDAYFAKYQPDKLAESASVFGSKLIIRSAESQDLEGLARLCFERYRDSIEVHRDKFQAEISNNPGWQDRLLLVAIVDDSIVGFARANYFEPTPDSLSNVVPPGWYLGGIIVTPGFRRRGIGLELTRRRLNWIAERANVAFCCINALNEASIDLHLRFQFNELSRDISFPGSNFTGGVGILFGLKLRP